MKKHTTFRHLQTLALALAFALLFVLVGGGEARAADEEAPYEKICEGGYKIEGSGYLFVGSQKAAMFNGNARNAAANATAQKLADGKEIVNVSTAAKGADPIELGGLTFQPVAVEGTLEGTAYVSVGRRVLVTGDLLGSGTVMLNKPALDIEFLQCYNGYCAYLESVERIAEKVSPMKDVTICTAGGVMDKKYFTDLQTIVTKFVKAEDVTSYRLKPLDTPCDFSIEWGSVTLAVHMPNLGLYGYDLMGTSMYPGDNENHRFYIYDYGKFQSIHDSDIQNCYLLMNDKEALIVDVDMYNGPLFYETLCKVIGDRDLYIYITHQHGDHWINLKDFDADRVTTLYWPEGDIPSGGQWAGTYQDVADRFADKITYVKEGDELNVAGREFVVCNMTAHTPHGTVLVDKTDRVLFCGDALGTRNYGGGTSTGSLTAEAYLAELYYLKNTYGKYYDVIHQGHSALALSDEVEDLIVLVRHFLDNGPSGLSNGNWVVSYLDHVVTPEEYANIFGHGFFDTQLFYVEQLEIGRTALEAYKS